MKTDMTVDISTVVLVFLFERRLMSQKKYYI